MPFVIFRAHWLAPSKYLRHSPLNWSYGKTCESKLESNIPSSCWGNVSYPTRLFHSSSNVCVIDAQIHSFGRLVKAAIVDKDAKIRSGTTHEFLDSAEEDTKKRALDLEAKRKHIDSIIQAEGVDFKKSNYKDQAWIDETIRKQREIFHSSAAEAQDACFSERARAKAYELHKQNKGFWNPARLANLFRVDLARMRISLWASGMEEQAAAEGEDLDDTVERILAQRYGELDFPGDIAFIPEKISYKKTRDTYFFLDDEVRSREVLMAMRKRDMVHYRESPRVPKRSIPPVRKLENRLPKGVPYQTYPGKFRNTYLMWDISPSKNLYTRDIVVRESDGSFRTGNWQERRYAEDYRRFLKWPVKVPFIRPDETQADHVPHEARVPEDYKVKFD